MHPPILLSSPPVSLHQTRLVARKEMSTCSTCSFVITARGYLPYIRGVAKILREKVAITIHTTPRLGRDWMMDRFKIDLFLFSFFFFPLHLSIGEDPLESHSPRETPFTLLLYGILLCIEYLSLEIYSVVFCFHQFSR